MNVLVTGATAGIGLAIARRFVKEGARVIATGRRSERLEALRAELGERLLPVTLDVTDQAGRAAGLRVAARGLRAGGRAGQQRGARAGAGARAAARLDDWDVMVDTNVKGLLYCTRAALPGMVARDRGHVINIGSVAGEFPYPGGNVYGATKAFVHQFTLNLRADLHGTAVRVTDIEPGLVGGTEFSNVRFRRRRRARRGAVREHPAAHARGHRGHGALGGHAPRAREHQRHLDDAGGAGLRPAAGEAPAEA